MDESRRTMSLLALNTVAIAGMTPWVLSLAREADAHEAPTDVLTARRKQISRNLPNIEFHTHDGRTVRFYDDLVKGKKVLINFMYADCSNTCPRTTANLVRVQEAFGSRLGRDVFFLSVTLKPDHDTPDRLRTYATEHGCRPGWDFLTGRLEDITRLRRNLGVYDSNPDVTQHVGILTYGNEPEGKWGATSTLAPPSSIVRSVTSRIDGWVARPWPELQPGGEK
jgi:protein SCO1/2